jgi:hypothetical protein
MIMSVSTLVIFIGAATPVRDVKGCMRGSVSKKPGD